MLKKLLSAIWGAFKWVIDAIAGDQTATWVVSGVLTFGTLVSGYFAEHPVVVFVPALIAGVLIAWIFARRHGLKAAQAPPNASPKEDRTPRKERKRKPKRTPEAPAPPPPALPDAPKAVTPRAVAMTERLNKSEQRERINGFIRRGMELESLAWVGNDPPTSVRLWSVEAYGYLLEMGKSYAEKFKGTGGHMPDIHKMSMAIFRRRIRELQDIESELATGKSNPIQRGTD